MITHFNPQNIDLVKQILSEDRIQTYLDICEGDCAKAIYLYELNTAVSEALYAPIQLLEITLRNSFHRVLSEAFGECWYDIPGVLTDIFQIRKVFDAKIDLVKYRKPITPGRVVSSLTFGFWTSLLGAGSHDRLWVPHLHKAFKNSSPAPTIKAVNKVLTPLRTLRNRVAHHEPVLHWNLAKHHNQMIEVTRWLSTDAAEWLKRQSRFAAVHGPGPHWPKKNPPVQTETPPA